MTTRDQLATLNRVNWQTRDERLTLAALDFTPTIPCESNIGGEHDHPATWLLTTTCGHHGYVCGPIKDRAVERSTRPGITCPICGGFATLATVERIGV